MEFISVIVAAIAAFAFGSIWYMALADRWMEASGVPVGNDGRPANSSDPMTYITGLIGTIFVAGMMRHIFVSSGIETVGDGLLSGLGMGLFVAVPWLITNYTFAARPKTLMVIDGLYAVGGCTIIGIVLTLF